jgi:hypothetical protein
MAMSGEQGGWGTLAQWLFAIALVKVAAIWRLDFTKCNCNSRHEMSLAC